MSGRCIWPFSGDLQAPPARLEQCRRRADRRSACRAHAAALPIPYQAPAAHAIRDYAAANPIHQFRISRRLVSLTTVDADSASAWSSEKTGVR